MSTAEKLSEFITPDGCLKKMTEKPNDPLTLGKFIRNKLAEFFIRSIGVSLRS